MSFVFLKCIFSSIYITYPVSVGNICGYESDEYKTDGKAYNFSVSSILLSLTKSSSFLSLL